MAQLNFSPADVAAIRGAYRQGTLDVRGWANAREVSLETIRRIARGDTYKDAPAQHRPVVAPLQRRELAPVLPAQPREFDPVLPRQQAQLDPVLPRQASAPSVFNEEPDDDLLAASFARLQAKLAEGEVAPHAGANALLDEMMAKVRHDEPSAEPTTKE